MGASTPSYGIIDTPLLSERPLARSEAGICNDIELL